VTDKALEHLRLAQNLLSPLRPFWPCRPPLRHFHVGQDKLEIDDLNVAHGVGVPLDVHHVRIVKAAHDVDDRVGRSDVA
jgi:hypothetical protein